MGKRLQSIFMALSAFIIPTISFFSPLAIAPILIILAIYPSYIFIRNGNIKNIWYTSDVNKVLIILLIYSLISALWAIDPSETIYLWVRTALFFIGAISLFSYVLQIDNNEPILKSLLYGMVLSLIIANIEIFTNGFISNILGIHEKGSNKFDIVIFNRGASVVSIMYWAIIAYLRDKKKYKTMVALFIVILLTIINLDSLSTTLGFIASGLVIFPIVYWKREKALRVFAVLAVVGVFAFAGMAKMMDAHKLVGNVPVIPGAASDIRLYIWDYAAKQAYKKPIFGWGFNASRSYPVNPSDYVQNGRSPLPLHPHNNTLQIWLELGVIGLIIFSAFLSLFLLRIAKTVKQPFMMALCTALYANYFIIGQVGYGIWQNWWVASGIIAACFLRLSIKFKEQ